MSVQRKKGVPEGWHPDATRLPRMGTVIVCPCMMGVSVADGLWRRVVAGVQVDDANWWLRAVALGTMFADGVDRPDVGMGTE